MAGPYHNAREAGHDEARRLLDERLQREDREKNPGSPQPPFTTTVVIFVLVVVAMFAMVWLGF